MEIEILGNPKAEAVIDVNKFKSILGKEWDMKKAVYESIKVSYTYEGLKPDRFVEFIYLALDWTEIIDGLKVFDGNEIKIELFKIMCSNMVRYEAGIIDTTSNLIRLKETMFNEEDVLLKQSMIRNPAFTVRNYIISKIFNYGRGKNFEVV